MFTALDTHTLFSLMDGMSSSEDYAKKASQYNHTALAITDHGRASGHFEHNKACKKYGIKPIFGIEMYINDTLVFMDDKEKRRRKKDGHLIILAKNKIGYENLLHLNYLSNKDDEHFYYNPRVSIDEIFQYKEGLIIGSACMANYFYQYNKNGLDGEALYKKFVETFKEDFYTEVQLNEIEEQKKVNEYMLYLSDKYSIPVCITGDVHYVDPGNDVYQTLSMKIRDKITIEDEGFELEGKSLYYHDVVDFKKFNKDFGYNYSDSQIETWCNNTGIIADKCTFQFPESKKTHMPFFTDSLDTDDTLLIQKSIEGLKEKFSGEVPKEYKNRLSYELEIIIRKGFSNYFLILADIIEYAENSGAWVSLARGSSGGSLCAYAMGITKIDPIRFGLLFERFLSESRVPDSVVNYFGEE